MSAGVVFRKEFIDNLRDRRTLLSSFSLAILGPIFFVGIMVFVLERALGESDDPIHFAIVGAEHAPELITYLQRQNTEINHIQHDDPQQLVKDGSEDLVMVIAASYTERYERGKTNHLQLIFDSSKLNATRRHLSQLSSLISVYSRTVGALRMQLRGVDPGLARPLAANEVDVASPAARALTILASLPYFMVLAIFMGGYYLAIDTTAGEREHGSLEPLLTQPVSRAQLVIGKITATSAFGAISLLIFLVSLSIAIPFVPFQRIGMSLEIGLAQLSAIFFVSFPLIVFSAALLTVVASFAKSYKEAQTYLTLVILIPTLPIILAQLTSVDSSFAVMLVPSLSQATLMSDLIKGDWVSAGLIATSVLSTIIYASLLAWVAIGLYQRERILG